MVNLQSVAVFATLNVAGLIGISTTGVSAEKDDSYYIAGTGNPNVNEDMYWKDAENVLQDLSQFSTLYVKFHQCAWSWMNQMDGSDDDIEENDYWYMGKVPPFGANVAFSLYGSLRGKTFGGCSKSTFINTFHTGSGFDEFAEAMYYAGVSGFSSFSYGDDDGYTSLSAQCNGGYGVGCDYTNGFAMHAYSTSECNPDNMVGVKDTMSTLNTAMGKAECIQIYDYRKAYGGDDDGNDEGNGSGSNDAYAGTTLSLLSKSHTCFYQDKFSPDGDCPDPYGILSTYQQKFYDGIQESKKKDPYQVYYYRNLYWDQKERGKKMSGLGIMMLSMAGFVLLVDINVGLFKAKKRRKRHRNRKIQLDTKMGGPDDDITVAGSVAVASVRAMDSLRAAGSRDGSMPTAPPSSIGIYRATSDAVSVASATSRVSAGSARSVSVTRSQTVENIVVSNQTKDVDPGHGQYDPPAVSKSTSFFGLNFSVNGADKQKTAPKVEPDLEIEPDESTFHAPPITDVKREEVEEKKEEISDDLKASDSFVGKTIAFFGGGKKTSVKNNHDDISVATNKRELDIMDIRRSFDSDDDDNTEGNGTHMMKKIGETTVQSEHGGRKVTDRKRNTERSTDDILSKADESLTNFQSLQGRNKKKSLLGKSKQKALPKQKATSPKQNFFDMSFQSGQANGVGLPPKDTTSRRKEKAAPADASLATMSLFLPSLDEPSIASLIDRGSVKSKTDNKTTTKPSWHT